MDLKRKIAQLICIEIRMNLLINDQDIEKIKESVRTHQWGSIIIFDGEIKSTAKLIDELQQVSDIPLFVCSDLERGLGQHFKGGTNIPSNMALGATNNLDLAYKAGKVTAQEAKEIGINVVFSPSADVNNNPDNPIINIRAYSEKPQQVADFAQAFINGCEAEGVMSTAKHFPGHGDVSIDSHVKLPILKKSRKALDEMELYPFKQIIRNDVPAIMTAHISIAAIDKSKAPATLSKQVVTDLLRNELGFNGIIFTDALNMGGLINENQQSNEIRAILAGCDILLMPPEPDKVLTDLIEAVKNNVIPIEIIDNAYNRIQIYKEKYSISSYKKDLKRINTEKNKNLSRLIAKNALTKIKGKIKFPLTNTKPENILNILIDQDDDQTRWEKYSLDLKDNYGVETFVLGSKINNQNLDDLLEKVRDKEINIISFFSQIRAWKDNMYPDKKILTWIKSNLLDKKNTVVITFSNPYLIKNLNGINDYYCTYSDSIESQQAVTQMLFNNLKPEGLSPVTLINK
ncbi:MAG: hypothetical protein H7263_15680 [Candidatus Sericytochromatia bacterium]|nr:hypothetical protein [Candidatus Sericytochromatia bacterium]